jgi:hypothetical protein
MVEQRTTATAAHTSERGGSLLQLRLLFLALCAAALHVLLTQRIDIPPLTFTDRHDLPSEVTVSEGVSGSLTSRGQEQPISSTPVKPEIKGFEVEQSQGCTEAVKLHVENQQDDYVVITGVKSLDPENNITVLRLPKSKGKLRNDWSFSQPLSRFARQIEAHQTNCSLPVATLHIDNSFGVGSHVALWSQAICNSMEAGARLRTFNPIWLWLDQTFCDMNVAHKSPLLCYLPLSEFRCGCDEEPPNLNVSDPRNQKKTMCALLKKANKSVLHDFRAASTEYLFQRLSPLVIEEAERQVGLLFGPDGAPDDLITVHIRWGDKFWEMKLAVLSEYIEAVSNLLHQEFGHNKTANIYVATEDPKVYQEFQNATPAGWRIYFDLTVEELSKFRPKRGNRASHMSKNSKGRAGLAGFGSILVAMEARFFVLTSQSNWSRLINHLRMQVIDPRCNECTKMIDLRPGVW